MPLYDLDIFGGEGSVWRGHGLGGIEPKMPIHDLEILIGEGLIS